MAFKLAECFVEIGAQKGPLDRALGGIKSQIGRIAGTRFNLPGGGLAGMFGAAGAALGLHSAVEAAVDMESATVALGKATDVSGPALEAMKGEIFGLATSLKGVSLDSLMEIATTGAKLGVASGDLMAYTKGVAMVSAAMDDIPAAEIADKLGGVNSVFKLGVQGTLQLGSAIDKLADSGASSAQGIMDVSTRVASTAAGAKIGAPAVLSMAAALLDTKMNAELAGSSINRLINAVGDTGKHAAFARAMGITSEQFTAMVDKDPTGAIQGFLGALKGMGGNDQNRVLGAVGIEGVEGISSLKTLALQSDNLARYLGLAKHEFATLDQIQKSYNATAATTRAGWVQFGNEVQLAKVAIGEALVPALNTAMTLGRALGTGLAESFSRSNAIAGQWAAEMGTTLPTTTSLVDDLAMGFSNLPDFMEIVGIRFSELFTNAGAEVASLMGNLGILGDYIAGNWQQLVVDAVAAVGAAFNNLGTNLAGLGSAVIAFLADPTQGFQFNWTPLLEGFQATAAALPEMMKPAYVSMQDQVDAKLLEIGQKAERAGQANAGAKVVPPGPDMGQAGAEAGVKNTGGFGGKDKDKAFRSEIMDASSFQRSIQTAALSTDGGVAAKHLKVAEDTGKDIKQLRLDLKNAPPMTAHFGR